MMQPATTEQHWTHFKMERQTARNQRRERGIAALHSAGVAFETFDDGWHLRIQWKGESIDYLTGADKWSIRGRRSATTGQYWGVHKLIRYLATGEL